MHPCLPLPCSSIIPALPRPRTTHGADIGICTDNGHFNHGVVSGSMQILTRVQWLGQSLRRQRRRDSPLIVVSRDANQRICMPTDYAKISDNDITPNVTKSVIWNVSLNYRTPKTFKYSIRNLCINEFIPRWNGSIKLKNNRKIEGYFYDAINTDETYIRFCDRLGSIIAKIFLLDHDALNLILKLI